MLRVLLDTRPARSPTGIGRYARTLEEVLASGLPALELLRLDDVAPCWLTPAEEELELPALLERERVDVYHSPLFQLPAALPRDTRTVVTLHDAIPITRPELATPSFRELFEACAHEAATRADAVVCPSEHAREELAAGLRLPREKLHVLPEPPAACFTPPAEQCVREVAARYGSTPGGYVLAVGSLEPRKGPDLLLGALSRLAPPAPVLVWVGPAAGFDLAGEARAAGLADRVVAAGFVPDDELAALYAGALALVVPSRHEGFGLPVVEAFACGGPVIAARATALPEVAGDAALMVEPEDPVALATAIVRLQREPGLRAELAGRGAQRWRERFSAHHLRSGLAALYAALQAQAGALT